MVNDKVKRARHLLGAVERDNARIAKLADKGQRVALVRIAEVVQAQADNLAELHALALELVQTHGPGAGVSPDVMAAVVAPKDPPPHEAAQ